MKIEEKPTQLNHVGIISTPKENGDEPKVETMKVEEKLTQLNQDGIISTPKENSDETKVESTNSIKVQIIT